MGGVDSGSATHRLSSQHAQISVDDNLYLKEIRIKNWALEINHHRVWLCVAEPIRVSPILLDLLACVRDG